MNLVSVHLETALVSVQGICVVCAKRTRGSDIISDALVLFRLDVVRILTQDRCMVCAEHTIGLENVLDARVETPR